MKRCKRLGCLWIVLVLIVVILTVVHIRLYYKSEYEIPGRMVNQAETIFIHRELNVMDGTSLSVLQMTSDQFDDIEAFIQQGQTHWTPLPMAENAQVRLLGESYFAEYCARIGYDISILYQAVNRSDGYWYFLPLEPRDRNESDQGIYEGYRSFDWAVLDRTDRRMYIVIDVF